MSDFTDHITSDHEAMIGEQAIFFTATAAADGRINVSPKGLIDTFKVLGPNRVAYLDLGGSGNETHAHLTVDGRITIMMCNFQRPALILRLYGHGRPVLPQDVEWDDLARHFTLLPGTRQIFDIAVDSVQTSCGWGVPFMAFERERETMVKWHVQQDPEDWVELAKSHTHSIDGVPTRATDRYIAGE